MNWRARAALLLFGLLCAVSATSARAEVTLEGNFDSLTVTAKQAQRSAVIDAIVERFGLDVEGRSVEEGAVDGRFSGTLSQVLQSVLQTEGYVIAYRDGRPARITFARHGSTATSHSGDRGASGSTYEVTATSIEDQVTVPDESAIPEPSAGSPSSSPAPEPSEPQTPAAAGPDANGPSAPTEPAGPQPNPVHDQGPSPSPGPTPEPEPSGPQLPIEAPSEIAPNAYDPHSAPSPHGAAAPQPVAPPDEGPMVSPAPENWRPAPDDDATPQ